MLRTQISFQHITLPLITLLTAPIILSSTLKNLSNLMYQVCLAQCICHAYAAQPALSSMAGLQMVVHTPQFLDKTAACLRDMVAAGKLQDNGFLQVTAALQQSRSAQTACKADSASVQMMSRAWQPASWLAAIAPVAALVRELFARCARYALLDSFECSDIPAGQSLRCTGSQP